MSLDISITNSHLTDLTAQLMEKRDLTFDQSVVAAGALASEEVEGRLKKSFLLALAEKKATGDEISAFAQTFRDLARSPNVEKWADRAIDVCGTGGDKTGTFNISTAVMFLLAAAEVPVFKHGNRSVTSKCGSADLLAKIGIPMEAEEALLHRSLEELHFAFFFAPQFHPAFKSIMPVRRELAAEGKRTIFNILGPLINPGRPAFQLLGVFSPAWMEVMATALDTMGLRDGYIVHSRLSEETGFDELSTVGVNLTVGFGESRGRVDEWNSERYRLPIADLSELAGGDVEENYQIFLNLIAGRAPRGLIDSVLLNAGVAFDLVGRTDSVEEGIEYARELLMSGRVQAFVEKVKEFYRSTDQ